jgi:hypothetical protein
MAEDVKELLVKELETYKTDILKQAADDASKSAKSMVDLVEQKIAAINQLPSDVKAEDLVKMKNDIKSIVDDWAEMEKLVKQGRFKKEGSEGKMFAESFADATKEAADKLKSLKKGERLVLDLKDMQFGNSFTNAGASITYVKPGIIELPKRKLHIRELLQGGQS